VRAYVTAEERQAARRASRRAFYQRHMAHIKAYNHRYLLEHKTEINARARLRANSRGWTEHLKKRYGLTDEIYEQMIREQGGQCFLCGPNAKNPRRIARSLCIDHDHVTKRVRKLLCDRCNRLLGLADENPMILRSAARYAMTECGKECTA
jgi:hypothetical protein